MEGATETGAIDMDEPSSQTDDGVDSGGGAGAKFDVEGGGEGGMPPVDEGGCQRVDFLFVIDNSASMEDEQAKLVAAFPGFMDAIASTLQAGSDYHVLVTDTDAWGRCNTANGWNGADPNSSTCNNYIKNTVFGECDRVRGAGVVHPAGQFASNQACQPLAGNRYIVEGEPDLSGTFACMATVGVAGHASERPMDGMVAALQPELNAAGGCNEGFLRDDALLVITFISDDPWYEDHDGPTEWHQAVVDAKNGDPGAVVVLGLTPAWPGCRDGNGSPKGDHWAEFISMWGDAGLHGNVCSDAADYVAFFEQAVQEIDAACDQFEPPG